MTDKPVVSEDVLEAAARAAHEANRAYCLALNDSSQSTWQFAPEWQKQSAREGVLAVLRDEGPEELHASWLAHKAAEGWRYGPVKDPEKKEHPCFMPYRELPAAQRKKDELFCLVVRAMLSAFDLGPLAERRRRLSEGLNAPDGMQRVGEVLREMIANEIANPKVKLV